MTINERADTSSHRTYQGAILEESAAELKSLLKVKLEATNGKSTRALGKEEGT
jgi:hypothetical protein